jgi:Spy/CpxP family protein refolding chaperone
MNDEQKAQVYGSLLNEHTKYFNEINRIKADNLDLNREQRLKIQELENKQREVMEKVKKLFS